jgi:IS605 OrfB family transposase
MTLSNERKLITAQIRLYLHRPVEPEDMAWTEVDRILRVLSYETVLGLNHAITECHLFERAQKQHWRETGENLPVGERAKLGRRIYAEVRGIMKTAASGTASLVVKTAVTKYRNSLQDINSLRQSIPSYRLGHPVLVRAGGGTAKIWCNNGSYFFRGAFQNKDYDPTRIAFLLDTFRLEKSRKTVLDRIISGEYRLGVCQVARDRRRRWFVRIAYSFVRPEIRRDPSVCVGVSLGLAHPFCCALNNGRGRLDCDEARMIERLRGQIRKRISGCRGGLKFSSRGGHGRAKSLAPVLRLSEKEKNFRDTKYHQYTSRIVEFAVKHNAGLIQIERLERFQADRKAVLGNWAIADFYGKLNYKAKFAGIEVLEIDGRNASRRCSECGCIDTTGRTGQADFLCTLCGYSAHTDYNTARNVAIPGIEKPIGDEVAGTGCAEREASSLQG